MRFSEEPIRDIEWDAAEALEAAWESGVSVLGGAERLPAVHEGRLSPSPAGLANAASDEVESLLLTAHQLSDLATSLPLPSLALRQRVRGLILAPNSQPVSKPARTLGRLTWLRMPYLRICLLYTSPSPRDRTRSRMPSSA